MFQACTIGSLRARLLLAAVSSVLIVLFLVGFGLTYLFEQNVERRVEKELQNHLNQLIHYIHIDPDGSLSLSRGLSDPRFDAPYSGLYWQISDPDGVIKISRSLWDVELEIGTSVQQPQTLEYVTKGPLAQDLLVVVRGVTKKSADGVRKFWFAVALDHSEITALVYDFARETGLALALFGIFLFFSSWLQVSYGLLPLNRLSDQIAAIRHGKKNRIDANHPTEIEPLVMELNGLLEQQEVAMERSRVRTGSLAHGLKTPLAAIIAEVRKFEPDRPGQSAQRINDQVELMEKHVQRELIRARDRGHAHGIRNRTSIEPLTHQIVDTLKRLPRGRELFWEIEIPKETIIVMNTDDAAEILGNILDNARKWARSRVRISARTLDKTVSLAIEDDGPGVSKDAATEITKRGTRIDETVPGSGLGLAIVTDILTEYDAPLKVYDADLGGFGVEVEFTDIRP